VLERTQRYGRALLPVNLQFGRNTSIRDSLGLMSVKRARFAGLVVILALACGESKRSDPGSGPATGGVGGMPGVCGTARVVCAAGQTCEPQVFLEPRVVTAALLTERILVGDVDADGDIDLVVLGLLSGVGALLNNGTGSFEPLVVSPTERETSTGALADFDRDGYLDLAVGIGPLSSGVMLGNGDGTFRGAEILDETAPGWFGVADLNLDSFPDVAMAIVGIRRWLGNGDGTFSEPNDFDAGFGPGNLTFADVNGDARPDALVTMFASADLSLLVGNGDGTLAPFRPITGGEDSAVDIATGDLNRDGAADVVALHQSAPGITVLLGNGSGEFAAPEGYDTGPGATGLVLADFDGDGALDVATANNDTLGSGFSASASLVYGNGDGTLRANRDFDVPQGTVYVNAADLDGDGRIDLIVSGYSSSTLTLFFGTAEESCVP
jgi:large repetitive protein